MNGFLFLTLRMEKCGSQGEVDPVVEAADELLMIDEWLVLRPLRVSGGNQVKNPRGVRPSRPGVTVQEAPFTENPPTLFCANPTLQGFPVQ